jgi:glycosyltransferase involved in cell wall biosynthesis
VERPRVSVVIPNYNGACYLANSISSVLQQDFQDFEIIVVDDGSIDNSLEIIRGFGNRIELIESHNKGASNARNLGIKFARGEYIAFLDSDDIWLPNKLSSQLRTMHEQNLDLVYCHGEEFGDTKSNGVKHIARYSGNCYEYFKRYPGRAIIDMGPSTALVKKSIVEVTGLFDTKFKGLAEDWDFFRRYCRNTIVGYCDEVLVYRRNHGENLSNKSILDFYVGNSRALHKMFREDSEIQIFEKILILFKFHIIFLKSLIKRIIQSYT